MFYNLDRQENIKNKDDKIHKSEALKSEGRTNEQ